MEPCLCYQTRLSTLYTTSSSVKLVSSKITERNTTSNVKQSVFSLTAMISKLVYQRSLCSPGLCGWALSQQWVSPSFVTDVTTFRLTCYGLHWLLRFGMLQRLSQRFIWFQDDYKCKQNSQDLVTSFLWYVGILEYTWLLILSGSCNKKQVP